MNPEYRILYWKVAYTSLCKIERIQGKMQISIYSLVLELVGCTTVRTYTYVAIGYKENSNILYSVDHEVHGMVVVQCTCPNEVEEWIDLIVEVYTF